MSDAPVQRRRRRFSARQRVRGRRDFARAYAAGRRLSDARITLWAAENGLNYARLGLAVGRRHGGASRRNRLKRVLREAFRLSQHDLPVGLDLICVPRPGGDITLAGCVESLTRLAARLAR